MNNEAYLMLERFKVCLSRDIAKPSLPTVAIANPPYVEERLNRERAYEHYDSAYKWKQVDRDSDACLYHQEFQRTPKLQSRIDKAALFTELCVKACQPGEVIVILLPNGILSNPSYHPFRWWLTNRMTNIVASMQFPTEMWQIECSLTLVTSILVLQRKRLEQHQDYSIFMALAHKVGYDSRRRPIYKRTPDGESTGELDDDLPLFLEEFTKFLCQPY